MNTTLLVTIPEDFADLLRALCVARKAQQSLDIHDPMLVHALTAQGLVEPSGAGWVATGLLAEVSALPGSAAVLASQLRSAAAFVAAPAAFASAPASVPAPAPAATVSAATASAPPPPATSSPAPLPASSLPPAAPAGGGIVVTPRFTGYEGALLRPASVVASAPGAPGAVCAPADTACAPAAPGESASFGVRPVAPSSGLLDPDLLRHVQVMGICLENLQQELDRLLAPSLAVALACPDSELRAELARSLPPCELRSALLASVAS